MNFIKGNKIMNILYLLDNPQLYGSEMHLYDIISYMQERNSVYLVVFRNGPLVDLIKQTLPGIQVFVIPSGYLLNINTIRIVKKIISEKKIRLIHAHQPKAIFIGVFLKKLFRIPLISTIHSQPIDHALVFKGLHRLIVFCFHNIINFIGQLYSNKLIFVSTYMLQKSIFPRKSILIYNWLRPNIAKEASICNNNKKSFNSNKIHFVSCGSVTYSKGYDLLFLFIKALIQSGIENFDVTIAGGIDKNFWDLQKKALTEDVLQKINFLSYINNVSELYKKGDIFVLFSRAETFGLVYIEAMSFGLPIICKDIPVLHEIIPDGNCITDNLEFAIKYVKEILDNSNDFYRISTVNSEIALKKYSYIDSMKKLDELYEYCILGK